jgi:ubiquinone/menaquinone biosynthesis C-methylase UbiE
MKCICCLSDKVDHAPFKLEGYLYCQACRFLFKPSGESKVNQQQIARHYEAIDPHEQVAKSKTSFFRHALEKLPDPGNRNMLLLDVGCGHGYFLELARRKGWHVKGVEIAEAAVEQSRRNFGRQNIFQGQVEKAGYKSQTFDAVTLWDVLILTDDPARVLSECMRILKNSGKIGIRVRNATVQQFLYRSYHPFRNLISKLGIKRPYVFHPNCFTNQSIYLLLNRLGYKNIQVTPSPLTSGDPYDHIRFKGIINNAKKLISLMDGFLYKIGKGRLLLSPSLLVWANKPSKE